jgi:multiple sugar transport system substrate-binding protein
VARRGVRIVALLASAMLVVSACSSGAGSSVAPSSSTGAPAGDVINLVLQHMETPQYRVDAFQKVIDGFNQSQSKYQVSQETVGWDTAYQRVTAQIQSGQVPDMVEAIPAFFTTIRSTGKLPPATTVFNKLASDYKFLEPYVAQYRWDNEVWAVPTWGMVEVTFYNKALFKKAGVEFPTTWSETLAAAKALTKDGVYGYVGPAGGTFNGLQVQYTFMEAAGAGNIYDEQCKPIIDNPQTVKAFEFYKELLGYSAPDSGSYGWAEVANAFVAQKAAMITYKGDPIGTWSSVSGDVYGQNAGLDPADLGIGVIPKPDTGPSTDTSLSYSNGIMVMTADPARQEGIYQFLKYFLEPNTYGTWLATAQPGLFLPVTDEGKASATFWENPIIKAFKPQIEETLRINDDSALYGFTQKAYCPAVGQFEGTVVLAKGLEKMMASGMAPADAVKWVSDQMQTQK